MQRQEPRNRSATQNRAVISRAEIASARRLLSFRMVVVPRISLLRRGTDGMDDIPLLYGGFDCSSGVSGIIIERFGLIRCQIAPPGAYGIVYYLPFDLSGCYRKDVSIRYRAVVA